MRFIRFIYVFYKTKKSGGGQQHTGMRMRKPRERGVAFEKKLVAEVVLISVELVGNNLERGMVLVQDEVGAQIAPEFLRMRDNARYGGRCRWPIKCTRAADAKRDIKIKETVTKRL